MAEKAPHNAVQGYADLPNGKTNFFFHFKVKNSIDACKCLDRLESKSWKIRKAYFRGYAGNSFEITHTFRQRANLITNL